MSEGETTIAISKVEGEIEEVAAQIKKVEKELEENELPRDKTDYLRNEKARLGKKEEQLRKKEEQLRKEKILILQLQQQQQDISAPLKRVVEATVQRELAKRPKNEPPERILSFVSKSQAFADGKLNDRITFGHDFFFRLVDPITTTAFEAAAPSRTADENKDHHPYFLREASKLVNSAINNGVVISQQLLWAKSGQWLSLDDKHVTGVEPDFCSTSVDLSRKNLDGSQFYVSKPEDGFEKPSKYDVTLTFEQKKMFVESDQIEAIDYAERILRVQRGRTVTYTALFFCCENEKVIRWMKVSAGDGHYVTQVSRPASLAPYGLGQQQLLTMLSKTSEELGRSFPNLGMSDTGEEIKISSALGNGATSDVYLGSVGDNDGVLKVLKENFEHLADHEASTLNRLHDSKTPFLVGCSKVKPGVLFFREFLTPIRILTETHVIGILKCLEHSHREAKVVHRDIRPENIMERSDGSVRVVDWGLAHVLGSTTPPFQGTFRFAGDEVLDAAISGQEREPQPMDDLESFVRVVYARSNATLWRALVKIQDGDFSEAKQLWKNFRGQNPGRADMFDAAANLNYEYLTQILPRMELS